MQKQIAIICAWCPDKVEKDKEAKEKDFTVSHTICKACQEVQDRAFNILIFKG